MNDLVVKQVFTGTGVLMLWFPADERSESVALVCI